MKKIYQKKNNIFNKLTVNYYKTMETTQVAVEMEPIRIKIKMFRLASVHLLLEIKAILDPNLRINLNL
jgi:hypothetical protein